MIEEMNQCLVLDLSKGLRGYGLEGLLQFQWFICNLLGLELFLCDFEGLNQEGV